MRKGGKGKVEKRAAAATPHNPYPGLRPFGEGDARWFFGRSGETRDLLDRLAYHRFVAVMGSSGCGKSSLVRAAIVPALRSGYDSADGKGWRVVMMRPGNDPIAALAKALGASFPPGPGQSDRSTDMIRAELHAGSRGIERFLRSASFSKNEKILVLVDQFEELFTIAEKNRALPPGEVRDYVQLLIDGAWGKDFEVHVLVTMRSENLGLCSRFGDLASAINDGLFLVPRMPAHRLRDVIEFPVEGRVDPAVVTRLVNDLGGGTDDLPLLQHSLMRLWNARESRDPASPISLEDLERVGSIGETIGRQVSEEILTPSGEEGSEEDRELAYSVFLELTEVGEDGQMNRQPKRFEELSSRLACERGRLAALVDRFRAEGRSFLQPSMSEVHELLDETLIDISHESIVRQWGDLRDRALEVKRIRDEIGLVELTARNWERHDEETALLEPGGRRLARAEELLVARPLDFSKRGRKFVEASLSEAKKQGRRRYLFRAALFALVAGMLSFVLVSAYWGKVKDAEVARAKAKAEMALADRAKAETERAKAETERAKAETERARAEAKAQGAEADAATAKAESATAKADVAQTRALMSESERRKFEDAEIAKAKEVANQRQLNELELALQRERAETELRSSKNREALVSLVTVFHQSLLATREYPDASRQLENFPDSPVRYLGEQVNPSQMREIAAFEAKKWPVRKFTPLAKPEVAVSASLEEAEVVTYFHYEYRKSGAAKVSEGDEPELAAGFFRETCRFRIDESLVPALTSLDRAEAGREELLRVVRGEFSRLRRSHESGDGKAGEEIARNRFWEHEFMIPGGLVVSAPSMEAAGDGTILAKGRVFRRPVIDGVMEGEARLIASSLSVKVISGEYTAAERVEAILPQMLLASIDGAAPSSPLAGVPQKPPVRFDLSFPGSGAVEAKGIDPPRLQPSFESLVDSPPSGTKPESTLNPPSSSSSAPGRDAKAWAYYTPWPKSYEFVKESETKASSESVLDAVVSAWAEGRSEALPFDVAIAAGELYLRGSNPNPVREQVDFYRDSQGEDRLRLYYDRKEPGYRFVKDDIEAYKKKFPERNFIVSEGSARLAAPRENGETKDGEVTVFVPFEFKHDVTSTALKMATEITFLIQPGKWPAITRIGTVPSTATETASPDGGADPVGR